MQESVTKRSDVFLAEKWLKMLEKDFCGDLVKDTTETLWLEGINNDAKKSKRHYNPFSFDFESLYDSLGKDLILDALQNAMDDCRLSWSMEFKAWLKELVKLSVDSAIGEYNGKFYKPKEGCPTGGSLSVQIANISVFYVLKKVLYEDRTLMKDIVDIKRFIDDGVGLHCMTSRTFSKWKEVVSERVGVYGLTIKQSDWSEPKTKHGMINFLDINFSFDKNKSLQTDLYRKPTDARSYLNFSSCHPPYTFSGVVFSQALRLRRIINDDNRLNSQLETLKKDFLKCGYPTGMLDNILDKIKSQERVLQKQEKEALLDDKVRVISTFGRDEKLTKIFQKAEKNSNNVKFSYVKKTGPSLKNILIKPKSIVLGNTRGKTLPCKRRKCAACKMMSTKQKIKGPQRRTYLTAQGKCTSKNIIYHAECTLCKKVYVGKTTQLLSNRINGHRNKFKECRTNGGRKIKLSEDNLLGMHIVKHHGLKDASAFNESYRFTVLDECNPVELDRKEHEWVQKLQCIAPYGLNAQDPFGIPLVL